MEYYLVSPLRVIGRVAFSWPNRCGERWEKNGSCRDTRKDQKTSVRDKTDRRYCDRCLGTRAAHEATRVAQRILRQSPRGCLANYATKRTS